eukprot:TRINITY_DN3133_c0_g1_i2.p1 TRINITY_DN3133_c0_g1~~TRINITY_DN3133_c0_g1_i2.p1  ORF type:complete len:515 (-),score=85.88 TRINITY_DN3133_c0_g1_i2:469-2013(-)
MRSNIVKLALLVALLVYFSESVPTILVDTESNTFVDSYGRTRIFHGVNAVYKVPPYHPDMIDFHPQLSFNDEDIQNLYDWGFNFIRLGMMWPGVETSRGSYNKTYISTMQSLVQKLAKKNIYVLLDCHQDLLSRKFCGEGVPDFAAIDDDSILPFPLPAVFESIPLDKDGYPELSYCLQHQFARYYFAEATGAAFQALYTNVNKIQDSFADFWGTVAKNFKSFDNVVGYELINEPWAGDIYRYPELTYKFGETDKKLLQPMYEKLNNAIRAQDDQKLVFFEPSLIDYAHTTNGFSQVPGGSNYRNRSVYSFHVYCGDVNRTGDVQNEDICELMEEYFFSQYINDYKRLGGAGMLTEWGNMQQTNLDLETIDFMTSECDRQGLSWAWWQFKSFNDITTAGKGTSESFYDAEGKLQQVKVRYLSRTYATATAGKITTMDFDVKSGKFFMEYELDKEIKQPTEIYLNEKWHYPNGFTVNISPPHFATWSKTETNRIHINLTPQAISKSLITITILRK